MIIRGVCEQTGQRGEYVVKLNGSPEMFPGAPLKEIIASLIGLELGLQVPAPAVISISEEFAETMKGRHDNYALASKSIGLNFGSAYMPDCIEILPGQHIDAGLKNQLYELLAFDLLIGNPDRRLDKHNFQINGRELLIFDHEVAFSFTELLSFARNPKPWLILPQDLDWLKMNYCFHHLKGSIFDFSKFTTRLNSLNNEFWNKAAEIIPGEWLDDKFEIIKTYVSQVAEHEQEFSSELKRILL
jgi:hypothetical protein